MRARGRRSANGASDLCVDPLQPARQVKHAAFVVRKRARRTYLRLKFETATALFRHVERIAPYRYRPSRYSRTFLARDVAGQGSSELPRRVFAVWAGDNELTPARQRNLEHLRVTLGIPLVLVDSDNLDDWIVDGHPLHRAYQHLALMHRADYLRAYLMHHHGGGYVDIKRPLAAWSDAYDRMSEDGEAWVTSYRTTHANWIGKLRGRLGLDILVHHRLTFGKCAFLMRSHTPLTAEWLTEVEAVLDRNADDLERNPAVNPYGGRGYPLSWHDLLGRVLDPLTLKHHQRVRFDDALLMEFEDYR